MSSNQWWFRRPWQHNATGWTAVGQGQSRVRERNRLKPAFLVLEDRRLLTTFIPVTSALDTGTGTLRDAVTQANSTVGPVEIDFNITTPATITLTQGQLELSDTNGPIAIDGPGPNLLAIDGDQKSRVFLIDPNVIASISGLTISGGSIGPGNPGQYGITDDGGGLYNEGAVTLTGVTVSSNIACGFGGGVVNSSSSGASITMTDCSITGNTAFKGGGLCNGNGSFSQDYGELTLTGCTVSDNVGFDGVGGLYNNAAATLQDCSITGNTSAPGGGGGIYMNESNASSTLMDCTIDGNPGGGVFARYGTLSLSDSSVNGNPYGSGVTAWNSATITDCTISGNSGLYIGGLAVGGTATITGSTISGNSGLVDGGGLLVYPGCTATITGCTISGNSTSANNAPNATAGGVEIDSGATATLTGCTISNNSSPNGYGGGVGIDGMATLTDCTISGNSATAGGGVFQYGTAAIVACTVSGNSSPTGGGIDNYSSPYYTSRTTLTDTIVAGNTTGSGGAASDIGGTDPGDVTGSYNLIGTGGAGGLTAAGNNPLNVANPGLTPLGDYGGPSETIALQPNSPAIGAGTAVSGVTTDQRGFPVGNKVDIGAFQSQPGPLIVDTAIDGVGSPSGQLSLRQAVNLTDVLTGGATIAFDPKVFDARQTITLTAGQLELSNTTGPITINGTGAERLNLSGNDASTVFQVDSGVTATIVGLTISQAATTGDGGGLDNLGITTLISVTLSDNSAADGGGIFNAGVLTAVHITVKGNSATNGGGIDNSGSLAIVDSKITGNTAAADGGGLFNDGTAIMVVCTVTGNSAASGGGIYNAPSGTVDLIATTVIRNKGGNIVGHVSGT